MSAAPDMLAAGLKMIASLAVVLALILGLLYAMRKISRQRLGAGPGKRIQVLESHYLGVKKTISLVSVPGKVLVLGISGDRINLLETLDETAVDRPMPESPPKAFGSLLSDRLKQLGGGIKGKGHP